MAASTPKSCPLEVATAIIETELFFSPNVLQRLEQDDVPLAHKVTECLHIQTARGVDEACPIACTLSIDDTDARYLETIQRTVAVLRIAVDGSELAQVFFQILAFLDADARLCKSTIAVLASISDLDGVRGESCLQLLIAFGATLKEVSNGAIKAQPGLYAHSDRLPACHNANTQSHSSCM